MLSSNENYNPHSRHATTRSGTNVNRALLQYNLIGTSRHHDSIRHTNAVRIAVATSCADIPHSTTPALLWTRATTAFRNEASLLEPAAARENGRLPASRASISTPLRRLETLWKTVTLLARRMQSALGLIMDNLSTTRRYMEVKTRCLSVNK